VIGVSNEKTDGTDIQADILDEAALLNACKTIRPNAVIHLAAVSFIAHGDPADFYRTNVLGTLNLLRALAVSGCSPDVVILASSAAVYGNPKSDAITEAFCPNPKNHYAASKLAMEHMANSFASVLPLIRVRPFNYTGPGQSSRFLVSKITDHFRRRASFIELGNLKIERDFSDVRDAVDVYIKLLERPDLAGEVFNLCSGESKSLHWVLQECSRQTGHELEIRVNQAFIRANDTKRLAGDPAKLRTTLDVMPMYSMERTLNDMLCN